MRERLGATILTLATMMLLPAPAQAAPPCPSSALALTLDPAPDGSVLAIRNVGEAACSVPRLPRVTLHRADGSVATGKPPLARYLRPGPVLVPLVLGPGMLAATHLGLPGPASDGAPAAGARTATLDVMASDGSKAIGYRAAGGSGTGSTFDENALTIALSPLGDAAPPLAATYYAEGPAGALWCLAGAYKSILRLHPAKHGAIAFAIDAVGGTDQAPNIGSLAGTFAMHDTHGIFQSAKDDCTLQLAAYGSQLDLEQDGDCGFGYAVSAAGRYRTKR